MEPLQSTLLAYLRQVRDFRKARGQRFAWSYLLALVVAALAAGQTSVLAMTDWAETHAEQLLTALQPACPRIPSPATWRRLVMHIDIAALEQQVAAHNQALDAADATIGSVTMGDGQVLRGQAVDGKDLRGASAHGEPTFLVSWVRHEHAYVWGQAAVARKTNEITVVPGLLAGRDLTRSVTTMDALLTQQRIAQQILAQGGHYLMIVKENQATLYEAVTLLFRLPPKLLARWNLHEITLEACSSHCAISLVLQPQLSRYTGVRFQVKPPGGGLTAGMADASLPRLGTSPQRPRQPQLPRPLW